MPNQLQRLLVALIAIPIVIGIVFWGGLPLALLMIAAAGLGASELVGLARRQGTNPLGGLAVLASGLFPLGLWLLYGQTSPASRFGLLAWSVATPSSWFLVGLLVLVVLSLTLAARTPADRPLETAATTVLIPLYCGALPSFALAIRYGVGPGRDWPATWAVAFPLAVIWSCDSAAMYGGRLMKGPKLAPVVSPGKTRSGAVSGIVGGTLAAVVYHRLALVPSGLTIPLWQVVTMGVVLSVVGQIGDLVESLFKREAGVKDSSHLIPGHGGVLDRLDSLYFVLPVAAMLYRLFGVL